MQLTAWLWKLFYWIMEKRGAFGGCDGKKAVVPWQAVRAPASGARAVKCGSHDKTELPPAVKHKVS